MSRLALALPHMFQVAWQKSHACRRRLQDLIGVWDAGRLLPEATIAELRRAVASTSSRQTPEPMVRVHWSTSDEVPKKQPPAATTVHVHVSPPSIEPVNEEKVVAMLQRIGRLVRSMGIFLPPNTSFEGVTRRPLDHESIDILLEGNKQARDRALDHRVQRRLAVQKAAREGKPRHRGWWPSAECVLQQVPGTLAPVPVEEDADADAPAAPRFRVEEDPAQPSCAISGEPFDTVYDVHADKWFYDGAIVLDAAQAAGYGLPAGAIVKANSVAGDPGFCRVSGVKRKTID